MGARARNNIRSGTPRASACGIGGGWTRRRVAPRAGHTRACGKPGARHSPRISAATRHDPRSPATAVTIAEGESAAADKDESAAADNRQAARARAAPNARNQPAGDAFSTASSECRPATYHTRHVAAWSDASRLSHGRYVDNRPHRRSRLCCSGRHHDLERGTGATEHQRPSDQVSRHGRCARRGERLVPFPCDAFNFRRVPQSLPASPHDGVSFL